MRQGENRKSVPADIFFGDLTLEKIEEILNQELSEDRELGLDPETKEMILLKTDPMVLMFSLVKHLQEKPFQKELALWRGYRSSSKLLALPRVLGIHPETNEEVKADYGRFGPYVTAGKGKTEEFLPIYLHLQSN